MIRHFQFSEFARHSVQFVFSGNGIFPSSNHVDPEVNACRVFWFRGVIAHAAGQTDERDTAWRQALACSPIYVSMLKMVAPENESLARDAVRLQPDSADAWFWQASLSVQKSPPEAIKFYQRGLEINPSDGLRWRELADILRAEGDLVRAINAYLQSCYHGDPGANGCYGAGLTAEMMGDTQNAIEYYRLSEWDGALQRANQLQEQINSSP
jgi:tetratricopeptide (TPR) repeat protein